MDVYLVGGAVRDKLLGLPVKERDWVIVGSTPDELLQLGYRPVGKDFPVFLHPKTHEEYALARTERKTGAGYKGFACYFAPDVTLEEDLLRRDLTINAIAQSPSGDLIDPYGGQKDLSLKTFRHVSEAFSEDPLRLLRVARFGAKLPEFTVAPETLNLLQIIAGSGELAHLTRERVWAETVRALGEISPLQYFTLLREAHALDKLFPELADFPITQARYHLLSAITQALPDAKQRFAALFVIPEDSNQAALLQFTGRERVPTDYKKYALAIEAHLPALHLEPTAESFFACLKSFGALGQASTLPDFLDFADCYCKLQQLPSRRTLLTQAQATVKQFSSEDLRKQGLTGKPLGEAIKQAQIQLIHSLLTNS